MQQFNSQELASRVETTIAGLEESKAINVNVLNFEGKGLMADALVIVNGTSNVHMQAIATKLAEKLKDSKIEYTVEGINSDIWVLVDCGDMVIHIFSEESRGFYGLERLWGDMEQTA
ncbi:MAG TPA: ribosome silencing factor [Alphaproteobacteria bacterium]|nr:ribosome silencing factor [Alphaproteobacteria bacterium]